MLLNASFLFSSKTPAKAFFTGYIYNAADSNYLAGIHVSVWPLDVQITDLSLDDLTNHSASTITNEHGFFQIELESSKPAHEQLFTAILEYQGSVYIIPSKTLFDNYMLYNEQFNGLYIPLDIS